MSDRETIAAWNRRAPVAQPASNHTPDFADGYKSWQAMPGVQEVLVRRDHVVILGAPGDEPAEWPEDDPRRHNCDAMGCGRSHVLWRGIGGKP